MSGRITLLALLMVLTLGGCSVIPTWLGGDAEKKEPEKLPGTRLDALKDSTNLKPDEALAKLPMQIPAAEANDSWAQHGGNAQAAMQNPALPAALGNRQSASIGRGNAFNHKLVITPVVAGGVVFAMDAEGYISAHDAKHLDTVKWQSRGVVDHERDPILGGGLAVEGNRVFAVSGRGLVAAFDAATGNEVWRQALNIPIRSAPRVADGHVYVVTVDSQVYALDASNGAVLWAQRGINEGTGFLIEATPAVSQGLVAAPFSSGEVHVLHTDDGTAAWYDAVMGPQHASAISVFTGIGGDPVIRDDYLYVAGSADMFAAFQLQTGRRIWDQPIPSVNAPFVAGDYVFVLTSSSAVVAMQRLDGRVRWVRQLPQFMNEQEKKERYTWNGPVLAGGRLLVAGAHGQMAEIKPEDGTVIAMTEIPSDVYAPPVVAGGVAYLVSDEATLYAVY